MASGTQAILFLGPTLPLDDARAILPKWAQDMGFASLRDLRIELLRARLVRQEMRRVARALAILTEAPDVP
jgi:hypothetical protein